MKGSRISITLGKKKAEKWEHLTAADVDAAQRRAPKACMDMP